jgi:hypothetical protein
MNSESRLILENWETVRDFVPANKRLDVAIQWLRSFEEFGVDPGDFHDLVGEDKILEEAYHVLFGEDPEEELSEDAFEYDDDN